MGMIVRIASMWTVGIAATSSFVLAQETIVLPPGATVVGPVADVPLFVGPPATTVQLPTFNMFTISTTVVVPDRGGLVIGGVNSGSSASGANGLFSFDNRSSASSITGGDVSVGARIIDLKEMDRALLAEAKAKRESASAEVWLSRLERAKQSTAGRPTVSVAEARRLRDAAAAERR